jgi:hypothetical protein
MTNSVDSILRRAAYADLALQLARWLTRHWNSLPSHQRAALSYALNHGGHVGNAHVLFTVQLSSLLEAMDALRRRP